MLQCWTITDVLIEMKTKSSLLICNAKLHAQQQSCSCDSEAACSALYMHLLWVHLWSCMVLCEVTTMGWCVLHMVICTWLCQCIITLCMPMRSRLGLCMFLRHFVPVCLYGQNWLFAWGLTAWKSPVSLIYCTVHLSSITAKKGAHYTRWFVQEKKFGSILLTEWKNGSGKLYYSNPCLIYMQCSYAILANAECQHVTAVQTYNIATGTVGILTVLRAHVFCRTLVANV